VLDAKEKIRSDLKKRSYSTRFTSGGGQPLTFQEFPSYPRRVQLGYKAECNCSVVIPKDMSYEAEYPSTMIRQSGDETWQSNETLH
jgi:hypothetical protein